MHQRLFALIVALIAFAGAYFIYGKAIKPSSVEITAFSLEKTIVDIKRELARFANSPGEPLGLELQEIKIVLLVQRDSSSSSNGALNVPVFKKAKLAGTIGFSEKTASKVTIVMVPPDGSHLLSASDDTTIRFVDLLLSMRTALQAAMAEKPALVTKQIEVTLNFVLTRTNELDTSIEAHIINIGSSLKQQNTGSNSITLKYLNPEYAKDNKKTKPAPP